MSNHFNEIERWDVLDKGFVQLLDTLPKHAYAKTPYEDLYAVPFSNLDERVVAAARASYGNETKGYEKDTKLLKYLIANHHDSPLEQVQYTFRIKAPLMVVIHLLRHRMKHENWQSYRYTKAENDEFYIPEKWRSQSKQNKQDSDGFVHPANNQIMTETMGQIVEHSMRQYYAALNWGVSREMARLLLPAYALYQTGIITIDLRNLLHLIDLRTGDGVQWETMQYANAFKEAVKMCNPYVAHIKWGEQ